MSLPHTSSLHRRKSPNVSPFLEKWRSVCGGQAAMTTPTDIMVCTKEWKQNSKLVYLYMSGCVLLACQVYLTDEGKMVTSLFAFDVKTHFLSSLPKSLWKEKKNMFLKMDCLCFGSLCTSCVSFKLTEVGDTFKLESCFSRFYLWLAVTSKNTLTTQFSSPGRAFITCP